MIGAGIAHLLAGALAIVGAKVEVGDGTVLEKATVVVDGGKIVAVGANAAVPANAERIDGSKWTVTPGIIAADCDDGLIEVNAEKQSVDDTVHDAMTPAFRAVDGFNPLSTRIPIDRAQGVTSEVLTPHGSLLRGQGFVVDLSGTLDSAGKAKRVAMFAGYGNAAKDAVGGARGAVLLKLREVFDDVRFYEKNKAAFDKAQTRPLSLSRVHLDAMIDVVEGRLPLVVEVERASDILEVLAFAKEQHIRVIVDGGREAWLVATELAAAKVPVLLQPMAMMPYAFDSLRARDDAPALLAKAGVDVVIAEGGDLGTTRLRQEAGVAVAYGMQHEAALAALTSTPARIFGVDDIGTVAVGKRADLVAWSGDPFETTTFAQLILINGEKMTLATRQTELVRKYRTLPAH